ncbi:MAG: hypothetical protein A4S16_01630 [Proteobacteria bacterium SG_bin6]|nr:MAG: hypothetical protein A4S16_01630 [Proteobacteria bacterium SG_bin6]
MLAIAIAAFATAIAATLLLSLAPFTRRPAWRATVTPLASIIGSGFLICGPLLAREFGQGALIAQGLLLVIAYAIGAVVRFNIAELEPQLAAASFNHPLAWMARVTQTVLAAAYAISIAYYLKLLAEFALKFVDLTPQLHSLLSNGAVTAIIGLLVLLAFTGGLRRVEHLAHGSVSLKLGMIVGMLAGLAAWWLVNGRLAAPLPPARLSWNGLPLLLGLLITVQGFETSRYLGGSYSAELRIATMRRAQLIAAVIYLTFVALLTPFLAQAAEAKGVAGILDIMALVAPGLVVLVLIGALASQLSAAVADSIGAGGLMNEVTRGRLSIPASFALAAALSIAVVWLTDPLQVVAVASRAFAVYYALQCVLAVMAHRSGGVLPKLGFVLIGLIALAAALFGAPAEE